ncbi:MAG: MFS transporter [Acidimicrobiaceae bacterium]|nr:MFS transporter [Acidimicrobiaceae bacterium]
MPERPRPALSPGLAPRVIAVLFSAALVAGFGQFGAVASLNDVARHFGHPVTGHSLQSVVGLSGSVLGLGLAVLRLASLASLPLTSLADRHGRTKVLRSFLLFGLLVTAVASLSPSYWFFVLCFAFARPLLSAASTLVQVVTVELSSTSLRMHRLVVMSAGAGIGAGLSAVLHGLIRGANSFRWLFALALVPALLIPPLMKRVPEPERRRAETPLVRLGTIPRGVRGRLGIVAAIAFAIGMITGPANGFAFVYGEGVLKISPHFVATVVALSAFTGLGGLLLSRWLSRSIGRRWTVAIGVVSSALTSVFAYSGGTTSFLLGYMSGVAAAGLLAPAATAISTEIFSHGFRATAAGWVVVAGVLGATAGLFLFGLIGDITHVSGVTSLRLPALLTFLPLTPTILLLQRLPESARAELH